MPLLSTSSFHNAARNAISGAAILGLAGFGSYSVAINAASFSPAHAASKPAACKMSDALEKKGDDSSAAAARAAASCCIAKVDQDIAASKARAAAADARSAAADTTTACIKFLTKGVTDGTLDKATIVQQADGRLKERACEIARIYGYGRSANGQSGPKI